MPEYPHKLDDTTLTGAVLAQVEAVAAAAADAGQTEAEVEAAIFAATQQFPDAVFPCLQTVSAGTTVTAIGSANSVHLYRFRVGTETTVTDAHVRLGGTSAGNLALGIYTHSAGTWTRVAATADTAAGTINLIQEIPFTAPYTLLPGTDYWGAIGKTDATLTLLRSSIITAPLGLVGNVTLEKASAYSSGLPATITTPTGSVALFWMAFTT